MLRKEIKEKGLNYELEYSKAYGGEVKQYEDFVHIKNKYVNYAGDFSRAIDIDLKELKDFDRIVDKVEKIHKENNLDKPNNFYPKSGKLDKEYWEEYLKERGYKMISCFGLIKEVKQEEEVLELKFIKPSPEKYLNWNYEQEKKNSYFEEEWYKKIRPATESFINEFKPYWIVEEDKILGWVYCQFKEEICNVHDVWIEENQRGRGLSRAMFKFINNEALKNNCKYLNLVAFDDRLKFYKKIGFEAYQEITRIVKI